MKAKVCEVLLHTEADFNSFAYTYLCNCHWRGLWI